jgi:hypothetical protein
MSQSDARGDVESGSIRPAVGDGVGHRGEDVAVDEPQGIEVEPSGDSAHVR